MPFSVYCLKPIASARGALAFPGGGLASRESGLAICGSGLASGESSARFDWKAPARSASVGLPETCLIERRVMNTQTNTLIEDWGAWKDTATDSEKTVISQPRGVEIADRVTAVNTNGPGPSVTSEQVVF